MKRILLLICVAMLYGANVNAQRNMAYYAVASHSGGGANNFGPQNYNDSVIAIGVSQPWGWVSGNGWIEYTWVTPVTVQDIIFYDGGRKVTAGEIQYWDNGTSSYVTAIANFGPMLNPAAGTADLVSLPVPITTTKLRFNNLAGSNPNFREIEVFESATGLNDAGILSVDTAQAVCPGLSPVNVVINNFGINVIDSVTVNWKMDGVLQTPAKVVATLDTTNGLGSTSARVTIGTYNFALATNYTLEVWTSMPNGAVDTTNYNDTLTAIVHLGAPTGLMATNVGAYDATVAWYGNGGTAFSVEWGPTGFTQGTGTVVAASDTFKVVTGLQPLTSYDIYVWANCVPVGTSLIAGPITITTGCPGSISGTYTLNPGLPYSVSNFTSFTQLALALNVCGITGPVTVNVDPNAATYEQVEFGSIVGGSSTNTVTINGNGASISYLSTSSTDRATLTLKGTDYLTIDSLRVNALGSASGEYGMTIRLTDDANYNTVRNCFLQGDTASTSSNFANFVINGVNSDFATSTNGPSGNYNTIEGNTVVGGYYGMVCNGQSSDSANYNVISNNIIRDYRYYGMYNYYNDHITVEGNDVSRPFRTNLTTSYGIYNYASTSAHIIGNRIHDPLAQNKNLTSSVYGMYMGQFNGTASDPSIVANNLIYNFESGGTQYGLYPNTMNNTKVINNTIAMYDPNTTATNRITRCMYVLGTITDSEISNNIFYLDRDAGGVATLLYMNGTASTSVINNNAYYSEVSNFDVGYSGGGHSTLSGWQTATGFDMNSSYSNPYFISTFLGDFRPQSAVLDASGIDYSMYNTVDIDGMTRGTNPDIGAYEFVSLPCTGLSGIGTVNIAHNKGTAVWKPNVAGVTIEWGPLGYKQASQAPLGTTVVPLGDTSSVMTGLSPLTCYEYYLTMNCTSSLPGAPPLMGPFIFCTNCATLPLSGTYTIGGTPGPTDFPTLDSAIAIVTGCGISGPVVFNMNGGVHNAITIGAIPGSSATNTVTFNGAANYGDSIVANSQTAAIDIDGAANLIFNDLYVDNNGGNYVVWLHNGSDNISFDGCYFMGDPNGTGFATAVMAASSSGTSVSGSGANTEHLSVNDCKFVGNYYGFSAYGIGTTTRTNGISITDCDFQDQYYYGIRCYYIDSVNLMNNYISALRNTASYGFYMYYNGMINVTGNTVEQANTYGMYSYYTNRYTGSPTKVSTISNNMFNSDGSYGLYMYGNNYMDVFHNTIDGSSYGMYLTGSSSIPFSDIDVRNNLITNDGTGPAIYILTEPDSNFTLNYNAYYTAGTNIANHGGNHSNLAAWVLAKPAFNANSVEGDPQYVSLTDLHVLGGTCNDVGDNSVGILVDIDGQTRPQSPSTVVDIGADEYTPVAEDLALISGAFSKNGKCLRTNDTITLDVQNVIGTAANFVTTPLIAKYEVTGPVNTNGTITVNTGTLGPLATMTLIGTPIDLSVPGNYTLTAYIEPSANNLAAINDTLVTAVNFTVYPVWEVLPDTVTLITNMTDTVPMEAKSPFLGGGDFFITEICQFRGASNGAMIGGWPTYLTADDYIEITGVPGSDIGGLTLEIWNTSSMVKSHTFLPGTLLSPAGTAVIMTGQGATADSPTNFLYNGTGSSTTSFSSGTASGYIIKNGTDIMDAVAYNTYTFPAASGVTAADWSGTAPSGSGTCGNRLEGPDVNSSTNWINSGTSIQKQDPNVLNGSVPLPAAGSVSGFSWTLNGVIIDTLPMIVGGPYSQSGTYNYVASFLTPCGTMTDTVVVIVALPGQCNPPLTVTPTIEACDSVIVDWTGAADSAIVSVVATGGTPTGGTLVIGDSTHTITGTSAMTTYDVYVANICGGDTAVGGPYPFSTGNIGAPVASFSWMSPGWNLSVEFDASASTGNGNSYAWDFGDGTTGTGVNPTHPYTSGGTKTIKLTVTNACGSDDTTITVADISLSENELSNNMIMFPNPASDVLNIELSLEGADHLEIRVMDISGKTVMQVSEEKTSVKYEGRLDVSNLAQGVYMIEVSDGRYTAVRRLIIE